MRPLFLTRRQRLLCRYSRLGRAVVCVAAAALIGAILAQGFQP